MRERVNICFQCHYNEFHMFGMLIMKVPGSWFVGETSSLPMWSNNFVGLNSLSSRWAFLSNHSLSRPLLLYTTQNSQSSKLLTQDKKLSLGWGQAALLLMAPILFNCWTCGALLFQYFLSVSDEASEWEDSIFCIHVYNKLRYTEENETAYGGRWDSVMY